MESVVSVEQGHPIAHGDQIVIGELRHWESAYPVVLLMADECSEVRFDCLVEAFRLPVGLEVEGS